MDTITINGLHKCQPKNVPEQGETKNMVVVNMPAKGDKKAWIKIKNELPDKGGTPYRILNVQPLDWPPDQYGNIAMNLEVEASTNPPSQVQQLRKIVKQGEPTQKDDEHGVEEYEESGGGSTFRKADPDWPESPPIAPEQPPAHQNGHEGVTATRKHLMQSANLLVLCIRAAEKAVAPHQPVVAQTSEQFQSDVGKLFIEASKRRTTDGVHWWSYVDRMPDTPLK